MSIALIELVLTATTVICGLVWFLHKKIMTTVEAYHKDQEDVDFKLTKLSGKVGRMERYLSKSGYQI